MKIRPSQISPNLNLTQTLTLTQMGIHQGDCPDGRGGGGFSGRRLIYFYVHLFFHKQSIFDPRPENCLSYSKKSPQKIV